jgi:hypothetical protein
MRSLTGVHLLDFTRNGVKGCSGLLDCKELVVVNHRRW